MEKDIKTGFFRSILIFVVRVYQVFISPILGKNCRFYPSCSNYFIGAVEKFGLTKGIFLSFKRIVKCHPFHQGGYDPLPEGTQK
ncbi:MAG: membrane protein insertion efficiency factor YidD [Candidatus Omnitrophica bacterium]|nr:membrane protein insertion efficiency factor YidD [Candidatus Omnitrophota bacterium]